MWHVSVCWFVHTLVCQYLHQCGVHVHFWTTVKSVTPTVFLPGIEVVSAPEFRSWGPGFESCWSWNSTHDKLEVEASFCYLGDMLSAAGGCELSTTTRVKNAWKKFKDLLPVLSSRHLSFKTRGRVYSSCVRSAMLHAIETWPLTKPNLKRLQRNDRAMIRQICNVRSQDIVTTRSNELLVRLCIEDLDLILKEKRNDMDMWNAPMVQSRQPLTYRLMESMGLGGPKWHGSSWQRGIAESGSSWLSALMLDVPGDLVWDLPCVQQASYLEGDSLMWILPLYLHVNQKSDYDIWYDSTTLHYTELFIIILLLSWYDLNNVWRDVKHLIIIPDIQFFPDMGSNSTISFYDSDLFSSGQMWIRAQLVKTNEAFS